MNTALAPAYRAVQEVTRHHAKSFYFSSHVLGPADRRAAYALYAFLRRLDDLVDETEGPHQAAQALAGASWLVRELFRRPRTPASVLSVAWPFGLDELEAIQDTLRRYRFEERWFEALLLGLATDLHHPRFERTEELFTYCDRVAGAVGLMLLPILGVEDARAHGPAVALGRAMQLTNVLRDVGEDLDRGRRYLPAFELRAFGVSPAALERRVADERFVAFMRWQIARARGLYAEARHGIPFIPTARGRALVRVMGKVYGGILEAIEGQRFDVFSRRARVGPIKKLLLAGEALLLPQGEAPASSPAMEGW